MNINIRVNLPSPYCLCRRRRYLGKKYPKYSPGINNTRSTSSAALHVPSPACTKCALPLHPFFLVLLLSPPLKLRPKRKESGGKQGQGHEGYWIRQCQGKTPPTAIPPLGQGFALPLTLSLCVCVRVCGVSLLSGR